MAEEDIPDLETPETEEEENAAPPKTVDDPDLPEEGDTEDFDEEPVDDDEFEDLDDLPEDQAERNDQSEDQEEPNDLSGVDKEFED